jgi:hypothetical protein
MSVVKLCTYVRGFYPTIWGTRSHTSIGLFIIIVDGKVIKRSFSELGYKKGFETQSELFVLVSGLRWIVANMDGLRDMNIQALFCGENRTECKKVMDIGGNEDVTTKEFFYRNVSDGGIYPTEIIPIVKMFNKVEYYSVSKVTFNPGSGGDSDNEERLNMYDISSKIFGLLYGNSEFNHEVVEKYSDEGIQKQRLVGEPELRWNHGCPSSMWSWS